jgi:small-conductance mechanosensitive channel
MSLNLAQFQNPGLVNNLASIIVYSAVFLLLIIVYWVLYNIIIAWIKKTSISKTTQTWINLTLTFFCILLTFITILIAFIDNLPAFLGSVSILSAAMVFTLQDFVACFFAWVYIQFSGQYQTGDNIQYTTDNRRVYGRVLELGIFRTTLKEILGGDSLDREMSTGRIVTIPNSFIFKHSLSNFTKNHSMVNHNFNLTISFESDHKKAKQLIQDRVEQNYNKFLTKADIYFDTEVADYELLVKPKIYTNINDNGIEFTIWFTCKLGTLRQVMETNIMSIYEDLEENKIELAYQTLRITKKF